MDKDKRIKELEGQISNLEEKVRILLNAHDTQKNQELVTFKKDLASSLRLEYKDFNDMKEQNFSENNYEVLRSIIMQVFRTLRRYEIKF